MEINEKNQLNLAIVDEINDIIKLVMQRQAIDEELPDKCQHREGCLVESMRIYLPGRINKKDQIECSKCQNW